MLAFLALACSGPDEVRRDRDRAPEASALPFEAGRSCVEARERETVEVPTLGLRVATSGFAVLDADGDGLLDLLVPGADEVVLLLQRDGRFEPAPGAVPPLPITLPVGASAADYDGDGDPDVVVFAYNEPDQLLRNDGGVFTDVTTPSGFADGDTSTRSVAAAWGDLDADGVLDVVVSGYETDAPTVVRRGRGDGTFEDVTAWLPDEVHDALTFLVSLVDLEQDGRPDLIVANDYPPGQRGHVVANRADGFTIDSPRGYERDYSGMGLVPVDLDHDGLLDLPGTGWRNISVLRGIVDAEGQPMFIEARNALKIHADMSLGQEFGWGIDVGDEDNDGDHDLVVGFGHWAIDTVNAVEQHDVVFHQQTPGSFTRARTEDPGPTRGLLWVDLDRDGQLDLVKRSLDDRVTIDRGGCSPGAWLEVALDDPGSLNRAGVGATVAVEVGDRRWERLVDAGSRSMFVGGPPEVHFGLGDAELVDRLEVRWPDNTVEVHERVPVRGRVTVTRGG